MDTFTYEEIAPGEFHTHRIVREIASRRTPVQHVQIVETESFGPGLFIDGRIQHVAADEHVYSETMVHPAAVAMRRAVPRRALCIGGGPGGVVRELLRYRGLEQVVQVEIDGELFELCKRHLPHVARGCWDDPRAKVVIGDGLEYLRKCREPFDLVISDVSEPAYGAPAIALFEKEGLTRIRSALTADGVFVTWAGSAAPTSIENARDIVDTVRSVFAHVALSCIHAQSYGTAWLTVMASMQPLRPLALSIDDVDRRLAERLASPPRFYDGETHMAMFHLPKDLRAALAEETSDAKAVAGGR